MLHNHSRRKSPASISVLWSALALCCMLSLVVVSSAFGLAGQYSSTPFTSSPSTKTWYRVPAMVKNAQGHLLVFAERRDNDTTDMGNFDIVMRRSTDGGRTWGAIRTIANDGRNRVSNPVPVFVPSTGQILLVTSIRNSNDTYKGIYVQRSSDGGTTFTPLLSSQIKPQGDWKGGLTGPGHGVVLTRGEHAGRILVPMGYRTSSYYGAYCIYSDDNGATWRTGYDRADKTGKIAFIEGTVAELSNGDLYINYRDKNAKSPGMTRLSGRSCDGGVSLASGLARQSTLAIHSVQGSALGLAGTHGSKLLFSAPTFTATTDRTLRRDMGIYVSTNGGAGWSKPYLVDLESKPAAYSDLVQLNDSGVGILYETGIKKWRERITFRAVPITQLTSTTKVASSVKGKLTAKTIRTTRKAKVRTAVSVAGIKSPPGKVKVTYYRGGKRIGSRSVTLTYSNKGVRYVTLPKLKKGTYKLTVTYSGTGRIKGKTVSAGTLRVKR